MLDRSVDSVLEDSFEDYGSHENEACTSSSLKVSIDTVAQQILGPNEKPLTGKILNYPLNI